MPLNPVSSGDPHVPAHNEERAAINSIEQGLESRIPFPTGAATGDLLRWDGTKWATTETRFFEGTGSPNGKVAAPVGSRYSDMTGTRGAVIWEKTSGGDSNTGWTTSIGPLALNGEQGTAVLSGPAATTKTKIVGLNPDIFLGVPPRQILLTGYGSNAYLALPYVVTKSATEFTIAVRNVDKASFTAASTYTVDWTALI